MINDALAEARQSMEKAIQALNTDLAALRTGRASTGLVDKLMVEYYNIRRNGFRENNSVECTFRIHSGYRKNNYN